MSNAKGYIRWYAKKAARKSVALGSWSAGSLHGDDEAASTTRVRVLTYHRFGGDGYDPFCVDTAAFEEQMRLLAESGLAITIDDLDAFLAGELDLADGSVLVTIDDGFRSAYSEALPILRCFDIPGIIYVPPGCMDGPVSGEVDPEARLSWRELGELARAGIAVGSHAWSHRSLGTMCPDEVRVEAHRSRYELENRVTESVTSFAYPFGTRADYTDVTAEILRDSGYTTAFTSQHGAVTLDADPIELPRVKVEGGEGLWMFRLLIRGGLDAWQWVDRTLWRLQANDDGAATTG